MSGTFTEGYLREVAEIAARLDSAGVPARVRKSAMRGRTTPGGASRVGRRTLRGGGRGTE